MTHPPLHVPPGHYYSPIPSDEDVTRALAFTEEGFDIPGVSLRARQQELLLLELADRYDEAFREVLRGPGFYTLRNGWFTNADAVFMALMLFRLKPRRIVEVGCGYSSALILDCPEYLGVDHDEVLFIEPSPDRLKALIPSTLLEPLLINKPVQDVGLGPFLELRSGDVLAIDSSHVMKSGSDVCFLLTQVLPQLLPGVFVHFHDIFYPFEYPRHWLEGGRAFNEAYALRILLTNSSRYQIVLFTDFLIQQRRALLAERMPLCLERPFQIGGLWIEIL